MNYEDSILIRPPSEASSFLLPVTIGCSHNRCTFCSTFKGTRFDILKLEDIKNIIDRVAKHYSFSVERVFLENGDAPICPQPLLVGVLSHLKERFPRLDRVAAYASTKSVLRKTPEQLKELSELGLKLVYLGLESGDDEVLKRVKKGVTSEQMVTAGRKLKDADIAMSISVILGLGGVEGSEQHAIKTAEVLNLMDPKYTGALTLMIKPGTPLYEEWQQGLFKPISPWQSLQELKTLIERSNYTDCLFGTGHASNYLPMMVRLPRQKESAVKLIEEVLARKDTNRLRPDFMRAL